MERTSVLAQGHMLSAGVQLAQENSPEVQLMTLVIRVFGSVQRAPAIVRTVHVCSAVHDPGLSVRGMLY
jgi:hypothetical protein